MPRYETAPADAVTLLGIVVEKYHGRLTDVGVKVDLLFARPTLDKNGDPKGDPVKLNGYTCAAVVRSVPLKLRAQGHGDAEITIDGDNWDVLAEEERIALLDHELTHLEPVQTSKGLKRDDLDRPVLRLRKHDHQFGWFDEVARRHGLASYEVKQLRDFVASYRQQWLPFMETANEFAAIAGQVTLPLTTPAAPRASGDESPTVTLHTRGKGARQMSARQAAETIVGEVAQKFSRKRK